MVLWSNSSEFHFCVSQYSTTLMLTGIQSSEAQDKGIWAWDCLTEEPVLLIPVILALLGDNPMQSQFACHIGLGGKFFCRACWVKGTDATGNADEESGNNQDDVVSDNGSAAGSEVVADDGGSDSGSTSGKKTTTRWKK